MRPDDVVERLRSDEFEPGYLRPAYEDYSFANVTPTVADVLGVDAGRGLPDDTLGEHADASNVLVVLIDGVRYDRWLGTDAPFFERARESGRTTALTSVYPSETAAAMTTYQTGRQPVEHGLLGWEQYFRSVGEAVEPLKGQTVGGRSLEPEVEEGLESFEGDTVHAALSATGVGSAVIHPKSTLTHPFSAERYDGATRLPYGNPGEGAVEARKALESPDHSFVTLYVHHVDSVSHQWGTRTPHYETTMHMLSASLERAFRDLDPAVAADTLVLFTADHGHVDTGTDGAGVVLTDREVVTENLARGPDGEPVLPTGGARNVHLHLREGSVERVREALSDIDALLFTRAEALEADLFGDREPGDRFLRRCGDLILVPNETSVYYNPVKFEHVGQHGGLDPDELLVPFTAASLANLV
jgi:predicted AlkP superfamily pyrophosphatase or phosphodiesterase